jgi:hypothetical protein
MGCLQCVPEGSKWPLGQPGAARRPVYARSRSRKGAKSLLLSIPPGNFWNLGTDHGRGQAVAKILEFQPFARYPDRPASFPISLIQRFDNADKHSRLIAFASGLSLVSLTLRANQIGKSVHLPYAALVNDRSVYEDGAELVNDESAPSGDWHDDVQVQIHGTPEITLRVDSGGIHIPAENAFGQCVLVVTVALEALEPFVGNRNP